MDSKYGDIQQAEEEDDEDGPSVDDLEILHLSSYPVQALQHVPPPANSDPLDEYEYDSDFENYSDSEDEDGIVEDCEEILSAGTLAIKLMESCTNEDRNTLEFSANAILGKETQAKMELGPKHNLTFKMVNADCKLIRKFLSVYGFHEVSPTNMEFNLMWTNSHPKFSNLCPLDKNQRVNHFPKSYEITRKDCLSKNIQRMQQSKGIQEFNFIPQSFVTPDEYAEFYAACLKRRVPWIVKPAASSRGRGIIIIDHPNQVSLEDMCVASRYIENPLLIDGRKFDIRMYIAVTSFDPLIVYVYNEGFARFCTVKYEKNAASYKNMCMHLTNYSINKKSEFYVRSDDTDVEDRGNKWSMSALLRYLTNDNVDTTALMLRIEDIIIKTLLSVQAPMKSASRVYVPHPNICFELYGFDILIDDELKPWIIEVNHSPSLHCDTLLDLRIKSHLIADMFNLVGIPLCEIKGPGSKNMRLFNHTHPGKNINGKPKKMFTIDQSELLRKLKHELDNRGGFLRIFPTKVTWDLYSTYFQRTTSYNLFVHQALYPNCIQTTNPVHVPMKKLMTILGLALPNKNAASDRTNHVIKESLSPALNEMRQEMLSRAACYREKKSHVFKTASKHEIETVMKGLMTDFKEENTRPAMDINLSKNTANVLGRANFLSIVQSRQAFAAYLHRLRLLLLREVKEAPHQYPALANESMDLMWDFMQLAFSHLPIKTARTGSPDLSWPVSKKLDLADKISVYLQLYVKGTLMLKKEEERKHHQMARGKQPDLEEAGIDNTVFDFFITYSDEQQLAYLLSEYGKNSQMCLFAGRHHATCVPSSQQTCRQQSKFQDFLKSRAYTDSNFRKVPTETVPRSAAVGSMSHRAAIYRQKLAQQPVNRAITTAPAFAPAVRRGTPKALPENFVKPTIRPPADHPGGSKSKCDKLPAEGKKFSGKLPQLIQGTFQSFENSSSSDDADDDDEEDDVEDDVKHAVPYVVHEGRPVVKGRSRLQPVKNERRHLN